MLEKKRALAVLQYYAQGCGVRTADVAPDDLAVFDCVDVFQFRNKLIATQRFIGRDDKTVEAAMVLLDLYADDEQPVKRRKERIDVIRRYVRPPWPVARACKKGLHAIVGNFDEAMSEITQAYENIQPSNFL